MVAALSLRDEFLFCKEQSHVFPATHLQISLTRCQFIPPARCFTLVGYIYLFFFSCCPDFPMEAQVCLEENKIDEI